MTEMIYNIFVASVCHEERSKRDEECAKAETAIKTMKEKGK